MPEQEFDWQYLDFVNSEEEYLNNNTEGFND